MRTLLIFIPIVILLLSCNSQEGEEIKVDKANLHTTDLKQIAATKVSTNFSATLEELSGQEVTKLNQVKANSIYRIRVESESPAYFRIKFADGFTVLDAPGSNKIREEAGLPSTTSIFTIKTNEDATSGIYVNIVPIHKEEKSVVRERSKNFMFPKTR